MGLVPNISKKKKPFDRRDLSVDFYSTFGSQCCKKYNKIIKTFSVIITNGHYHIIVTGGSIARLTESLDRYLEVEKKKRKRTTFLVKYSKFKLNLL